MIVVVGAFVVAGIGCSVLIKRSRSRLEREIDSYARARDALARLNHRRDHVEAV